MLTLEQYEQLTPCTEVVHAGTRMVFSTPSVFTKWRVESIYTKEPCTLEWIDGFKAGEVLVDVGANVGMYSIWSAATKGVQVFAFEPEAQNYALLNRNIFLNNLRDRVKAYCMGLSDHDGLTSLHIADLRPGGSCHSVDIALDFEHKPLETFFEQGCVACRLDDLVSSGTIQIPDHIKIDVDGFEPKVIAGARETLKNLKLKSVLVEINLNLADHRDIIAELTGLGFQYDNAQVQRATRADGPFRGVAEHVFRR